MLKSGDIVERYRVEGQLGQGGMATVYRVRHVSLGTVHALKLLHVTHPVIRERMLAEGRAQARLRHPHIVAVTDVLEVQGNPALLMEFVGGGDLDRRLARGPIGLDDALAMFEGIVRGVAFAHAQGVVHRDLKPANVLLAPRTPDRGIESDADAVPKVTDFGLAKLMDQGGVGKTKTAAAMGTPQYMAPEQLRDAKGVDARADVYSLGAILYELVCGRRAFNAADLVTLVQKVTAGHYDAPESVVHGLPERVGVAIRGALDVDRDRRIPDCETLLAVVRGERTWQVAAPVVVAPAAATLDFGAMDTDVPAATPPPAAPAAAPAPAFPTAAPVPPPTSPTPAPTAPASVRTLPEPAETLQGPTTTRTVAGLVVDERGAGHVIDVVVSLSPGERGVWAPDGVSRETLVAAQLALAVALGPAADRTSARWAVRGAGVELHGTSIGLAIAVAARAALQQVAVPAGWAFTGGIDLDGRVAAVDGVPAKIRAAAAAGFAHVAVPAAGGDVPLTDGVEIVAVRGFEDLATTLVPDVPAGRRRRRWRGRMGALAVPVLMGLFGVGATREVALQDPLVRATRGALEIENVVILGVNVPEPRALRGDHAGTLDALVAAGARTVFFDIAMSEPGAPDAELAGAIARAEAAGVGVVLPVRVFGDAATEPGTPALAQASRLGIVELKADRGTGAVRMAEVRRRVAGDRSYWHAAVLAAASYLGDAEPRLEGGELVVGPVRVPVASELLAIHPFGEVPVVDYADRPAFGAFDGKIAVIGAFGGTTDIHRAPDGPRYGVELEAGLIETLVRQQALRMLPAWWAALMALAGGAGAVGLGAVLPAGRRWLGLLVPLALLAMGLLLVAAGTLVALAPTVLAGLVALWVLRAHPDP